MTGDANDAAVMTDYELETLKQHCYAEGRSDESEAKAEALKAALDALQSIFAEVAGKAPPTDPNSYLPPHMVDSTAAAIKSIKEALA